MGVGGVFICLRPINIQSGKDTMLAMEQSIATTRLTLRRFNKEDAKDIYEGYATDVEVTRYLTWLPHSSIKETSALLDMWIAEYDDPKTCRYAITEKGIGKAIGSIDAVRFHPDGNPEIGYCLARHYWGKGYMKEALKALSETLFNKYPKIYMRAQRENIGSNLVIASCGYAFKKQDVEKCSRFKPYDICLNRFEKSAEGPYPSLHRLSLCKSPFLYIQNGKKDIEMRLYDEKRNKIKVGDYLDFHCLEGEGRILACVKAMHVRDSFHSLYADFPHSRLGYDSDQQGRPEDMEAYYPKELSRQSKVVGIEIKTISSN